MCTMNFLKAQALSNVHHIENKKPNQSRKRRSNEKEEPSIQKRTKFDQPKERRDERESNQGLDLQNL